MARDRHWTAGADVHLLSLMHRQQAKLYRAEQRAMWVRLRNARRLEPTLEMTELDAEKLSRITTFLAKATSSVLDLDAARAKLIAATDTDTLVAQLRHEFPLAAASFTDDETIILGRNLRPESWAVLDRVRAERFGGGHWAVAA